MTRPGVAGGGRYYRCMGTLWRHRKAAKVGDAALGMLTRIWSYCADQGGTMVDPHAMRMLMAGDKNGPRKLAALLEHNLLDKVDGGYVPHDAEAHNPILRKPVASNDPGIESPAIANVTPIVTGNVTGNVRTGVEQNQQVITPLSSPMSPCHQDQRRESAPVGAAALTLVETPKQKKQRSRKPADPSAYLALAALEAELGELGADGFTPGKPLRDVLLEKLRKLAVKSGCIETSARELARGAYRLHYTGKPGGRDYPLQYALVDWYPGMENRSYARGFMRSAKDTPEQRWTPEQERQHDLEFTVLGAAE